MKAAALQIGDVITQDGHLTEHYLSTTQIAERIGTKRRAISRLRLPKPDATIGEVRGPTEETIDKWNASRPGRGGRWEKDPADED